MHKYTEVCVIKDMSILHKEVAQCSIHIAYKMYKKLAPVVEDSEKLGVKNSSRGLATL